MHLKKSRTQKWEESLVGRISLMRTTAYDERDYTFGQAMLRLRTEIGLTQVGLAGVLGVSRRAVGEWEAGSSYPKVDHLKELIALGMKTQAFRTGHEAE